MANIFKKGVNWLPIQLALIGGLVGTIVVLGITYYFTPKYWRVGYQPTQPVPFSHNLHASQLGIDCRYCHSHVEVSSHSNVPTTQTCMNCHSQIKKESPELQPVRDSWATGRPIPWVRIHAAPDYSYFPHAVHVNRGVGCVSCHGQVDQMNVVFHHEPLSMGWCLECHKNPEKSLRPVDQVTNMSFTPTLAGFKSQEALGANLSQAWHVHPPTNCSACHR